MTEKVSAADVSRSCDFPKKGIFDGLHKCLKNSVGLIFPKKEIPFWEIFDGLHKQFFCGFDIEFPKKAILMADISNLKMVFVKITFFGNCSQKRKFLKRKLHVKNTQKIPEKS